MTLIELMVALLLGLVTTYFIAQVFAVAEGQKRTATFGSDAQVNGAVALYTLKRHIQASGYGLTSVTEGLGCAIRGEFGPAGSTAAAPAMNLAPIVMPVQRRRADGSITVLSVPVNIAAPVCVSCASEQQLLPVRSSLASPSATCWRFKAWDRNHARCSR
jgi:type IV pilus assembly protein PilW